MKKPAVTCVPIHDLIANRWSGRAYDAARAVSHEEVLSLLEAARWAPSCFGDQPWRFVVWHRASDPAGWQGVFDALSPGNQGWVQEAPVLILAVADTLFSHNGQPNRWAQYDTGAAVENLCLQAEALGLMAHQMGGFDAERVRAVAGVPEQYTLMSVISIGAPVAQGLIPDALSERELAPRKRHELGALCFAGGWNQPVV